MLLIISVCFVSEDSCVCAFAFRHMTNSNDNIIVLGFIFLHVVHFNAYRMKSDFILSGLCIY